MSSDNSWRKSSYSSTTGGNCVEVASDGGVLVRDTKDNGIGPVLSVPAAAWSRFLDGIR
jgi:Domain of unknown function (DUF397)